MDYEQRLLELKKKKKRVLRAVTASLAVLALFFAAAVVLSAVNDYLRQKNEAALDEKLRPPSYNFYAVTDENILEDEGYLALDRTVRFTDSGVTMSIEDSRGEGSIPEIGFMYDLIQMIINGEYESYNALFIESYKTMRPDDCRESFTMQRLHNIELEIIDLWEENTSVAAVVKSDFLLSYNIQKNNGTFRNDLSPSEDFLIPVVYRLMRVTDRLTGEYTITIYDLMVKNKYEQQR